MKLKPFLKDKRHFFIFVLLLLLIINGLCLLDEHFQIQLHNLLYLNALLLMLVFFYLLFGYLKRYFYFKDLHYYLNVQKEIHPHALPKPQTEEHALFNLIFETVYLKNLAQIRSLEENQREYEEFIDGWVHAVKTPITASYLLMEEMKSDKIKGPLLNELSKIEHYVAQALYYSKADDFSKDFIIQPFYLDELLRKIIKKESSLFIAKHIQPLLMVPKVEVASDFKWMFFIVDQLIHNALKYSNPNSQIKITYQKTDFEEYLMIEDYGVGIHASDLPRIFEKGFTGNNGRKYGKSTGIGLYLADKLSKKLGQRIQAESIPGDYTRFTLYFAHLSGYYLD